MRYDEYAACDATALAGLVARRDVTPAELLDCALSRLAAVGPVLNPIAVDMAAIGRARADEALSGPFAGVPFLLKDWNQDYAGQPSTGGSRARLTWISARHSEARCCMPPESCQGKRLAKSKRPTCASSASARSRYSPPRLVRQSCRKGREILSGSITF